MGLCTISVRIYHEFRLEMFSFVGLYSEILDRSITIIIVACITLPLISAGRLILVSSFCRKISTASLYKEENSKLLSTKNVIFCQRDKIESHYNVPKQKLKNTKYIYFVLNTNT